MVGRSAGSRLVGLHIVPAFNPGAKNGTGEKMNPYMNEHSPKRKVREGGGGGAELILFSSF